MQNTAISKNNKNPKASYSDLKDLVKRNILGVGITDDTKENILEFIHQSIKKTTKPYYIVTPNPEMIVLARRNKEFAQVLNSAKLALNDGVGVGLASSVMGKSLNERFTGVELVEKVCEKSNDWPITVGFLGGEPNVAEKAAECLKQRYPRLNVAFASDHWPGQESVLQEKELRSKNKELSKPKSQKTLIHNSSFSILNVEILFVAFGAPKQEFWMAEHVGKIPVQIMVGVGGAFDQIVHPSLRPPRLVQTLGLGWLYRLIRQPWRWKRQLALVEFVGMVFKEKLFSMKR